MLDRFFNRISKALGADASTNQTATGDRQAAIRISTAALMIEVARADHDFDPDEFSRLRRLIERRFGLSAEDALELSDLADQRVEDSVSLHEFTRVLHENLQDSEKAGIVDMLWIMAYADGRLDMYEDALVLKISDLLYVPRPEVMRLKHRAQNSA